MRIVITKIFFGALIFSNFTSLAQFSFYDAPIDCVRIERETYHTYHNWPIYNYLRYDSIDVNGLFRNGASYYLDSLFTSKPIRNRTDYDTKRRRILYQVWEEGNGGKKIYTNESFSYNSKGLLFTHKVSTPFSYTKTINDSLIYTSFDSISEKYTDYIYVSGNIIYKSKTRETYDYYPDHRLFHYERSSLDSSGWKSLATRRYLYSDLAGVPDTVYRDSIRFLYYKDEMGRDTLLIAPPNSNFSYKPMERFVYSSKKIRHFVYYYPSLDDLDYTEEWTYSAEQRLECYSQSYVGGGGSDKCYYYYPNGRIKSYYTSSNGTMDSGPWSEHEFSYKIIAPVQGLFFDFTILPNPAISAFNLICRLEDEGLYSFIIHNNLGQVALTGKMELLKGTTKLSISLDGISKGFYFLTLTDGKKALTKKFISAE
jgi:hypothetical protein